jgi:hypothetical protein
MSIWSSMRYWALLNKQTKQTPQQQQQPSGGGWWNWINSVASGFSHFVLGQFEKFAGGVYTSIGGIVQAIHAIQHVVARIEISILHDVVVYLKRIIYQQIRQVKLLIAKDYRQLVTMILRALYVAKAYAFGLVARERRYRIAADIRLDHEIKTRIKWLHQQIEREAASAYRGQRKQQESVITHLLDLAANLNPIIRPLVSDLIQGILDLAAIDNPVARIALGFLLRQVIDRLGLDKPIGDLLHNLLASVLGQGKPVDLHAVITDICSRLNAGEQQWAQFYQDGGSEVEQAGEQWQAITRWTTDAAILGLLGVMVAEPAAFARDATGALSVIVNDTIQAYHALIRGA